MRKTALDLQFDSGDLTEFDHPGHQITVEEHGFAGNMRVSPIVAFPVNPDVFLRAHGAKLPQ
jgi:hypothetical protein